MSYQIEIRHLKYFRQVATELNFRKAAEKLFITQPGLSRQIHQLESSIDAQLFIRDKRSVQLTTAGKYLLHESELLFNHLEKALKNTSHIHHGDAGELRIGFVGSAMQSVIPVMLKELNGKFPSIHTVLMELSNRQQIDQILDDGLDLGFIRMMDIPSEIVQLSVFEDTFSLVLPDDHPIDDNSYQGLGQLEHENFILFSSDYSPGYYHKIMSIFDDFGFKPRVSHESVHANTIFRLVENGLGIGIIPSSLRHGFDLRVKFVEMHEIPQRTTLSAIWKKEHHNPLLEKLIMILRTQSSSH